MLDVDVMRTKEIQDLLEQVGYGHLGCAFEGRPYVVTMQYYLDDASTIYLFTTEGQKTEYMDANPRVCLHVEDVQDRLHWRSVVVSGTVERLTQPSKIDRVMALVKTRNPTTLSPAISRVWTDAMGRSTTVVIYRIHPTEVT